MKNNFISTALLLLAVLLTASCSKDKDDTMKITPADMKVYRQVKQFREQLKSGLKNGTVMEADSALWYIETTLNLTYGSASFPFERMNLDTFYVQMPVSADSVSFADVQQVYQTLLGNITAQYHAMTTENKQFIFCHLRPLENQLKNGSETWEMVSGVGEDPINLFTFGPNDYWKWGLGWINMGGYCGGPYAGAHTDSDAAYEIAKKVRLRKPVPTGNYSYIAPFVNVEIYPEFYRNPNDTIIDNIRDFLLFRSVSWLPNYTQCIPPDDMNFYLSGVETIIYNLAKPAGLHFIDLNLIGDYLQGFDYINHHGIVNYAQLIVNPDPPADL
jgi:hypothetical protein